MGLLITGSVTNHSGEQFDHFYARIDHYQLQKSLAHICTTLGFYDLKKKLKVCFQNIKKII